MSASTATSSRSGSPSGASLVAARAATPLDLRRVSALLAVALHEPAAIMASALPTQLAAGAVASWTRLLPGLIGVQGRLRIFLEEQRARLVEERGAYVTIGATRREMQVRHRRNLLDWLFMRFQHGDTPDDLAPVLAA